MVSAISTVHENIVRRGGIGSTLRSATIRALLGNVFGILVLRTVVFIERSTVTLVTIPPARIRYCKRREYIR
jgi:hypothetical protein